jgi:hypothetical protein
MNAMSRKAYLPLLMLMALVGCASTLASIVDLQTAALPAGSLSTFEGLIVDPAGERLEGAVVTVRAKGSKGGASATTDAEGHFALRGLEAGEYEIDIKHEKSSARIRYLAVPAQTLLHATLKTSPSANLKSTTTGVEVREGKGRIKEVHNL